jgi:DNA-binding protein Fis
MWGATSLLLRRYTQRLGRVKYWIILSIPLAFFVSQFLAISLNLFAPLLTSQALFYGVFLTLIFTFSKPAGGILFGIAFWIVARNVRRSSSIVRDYMIISAYGLVLLFTSSQASVLATGPYPPFGLATASFIGLSSYLVLVGIYSSAISLAEDSKLRQSIRSIAIKESRLLDSIGMAQMEQQIQKKVIEFTKQNQARMAEESGIQSSLTEEDMKAYLEQVIREVKKDHQQQ